MQSDFNPSASANPYTAFLKSILGLSEEKKVREISQINKYSPQQRFLDIEEFTQIYLIGYNENKCFSTQDDIYYEFLSQGQVHIEQRRPPFVLAIHLKDDAPTVAAKVSKKF